MVRQVYSLAVITEMLLLANDLYKLSTGIFCELCLCQSGAQPFYLIAVKKRVMATHDARLQAQRKIIITFDRY